LQARISVGGEESRPIAAAIFNYTSVLPKLERGNNIPETDDSGIFSLTQLLQADTSRSVCVAGAN
jgi:hypothetical protein